MSEEAYGNRYKHNEGHSRSGADTGKGKKGAKSVKSLSFTGILFFILALATMFTLLIVAGVTWLSELLGSMLWACLAVGGAAAIISLIIYLVSVHRTIRTMSEYIDTIYETSSIAKAGYERAKEWIDYLF